MSAPDSIYGYCPVCGAPGISAERSPDGHTHCQRGHKYPHASRLNDPLDRLTADFNPKFGFIQHMVGRPNPVDLQQLQAGGFSNPHTQEKWEIYQQGIRDALKYTRQLADKLDAQP